jgi:cytochrome c peroxidase
MQPLVVGNLASSGAGLLAAALVWACGCGSSTATVKPGQDAMGGVPDAASAPDCAQVLNERDCQTLAEMALPVDLPPSHGNAFADNAQAAEFGFRLFYDTRLSSNTNVRCASCHAPESQFQDGLPLSTAGVGKVARNSPTVYNAARYRWLFWDGRADSLWSQALFPMQSSVEMNLSRLEVAHRIGDLYAAKYAGVFGALPALADAARFPSKGGPGDAAFEGMAAADRDAVNRVLANVGKALEAAQRKMATGQSNFDRYIRGKSSALTAAQVRGLGAFVRGGCLSCHGGSIFSDEKFHNVGSAGSDMGRAAGIPLLTANTFNARGPYYDGPPPNDIPTAATPADEGAFRTPSLRNVARTGPYGHDGRWTTLRDAIIFNAGFDTTRPLSDADVTDMIDFFTALNGDNPPAPWNDWPHY